MKTVALFAKAIILHDDEVIVITFDNKDISGEVRLSNMIRYASEQQKERIKKVLLAISHAVIDIHYTTRKT
jgi:hypothetical protein